VSLARDIGRNIQHGLNKMRVKHEADIIRINLVPVTSRAKNRTRRGVLAAACKLFHCVKQSILNGPGHGKRLYQNTRMCAFVLGRTHGIPCHFRAMPEVAYSKFRAP
jgi:hypothetical protein